MKFIKVLIVLMAAACQSSEQQQHSHAGQEEHSHETSLAPTVDTTLWTERIELFVEFPALVTNQTSRFTTHITTLENHQPVTSANLIISLIKGNQGIRTTADDLVTPGIFSLALQPKSPGDYQLVFDIKTAGFEERIVIDNVKVYPTIEEAQQNESHRANATDDIKFLKEQAWEIEFQTIPAKAGEIYEVIYTSGVWRAIPGGAKSMTATATGVVDYTIDNLTEGSATKKGQVLMSISSKGLTSNNLQSDFEKAKANYEQAKAEYDRKKELHATKIISQAEFEKIESKYLVATSIYETLKVGYARGGKQIRAPFDGFIKSINVKNGEYVNQGAPLISIGTHSSRLLETQVSPSYALDLEAIHNIWYLRKPGDWSSVLASGGAILSVGKEVESNQPLIPVYAQVNEAIEMPIGSLTEVQIGLGETKQSILVPEEALLESYGKYSVIVQRSGENYERRLVKTGRKNGRYVEVLEGLNKGEMVVTKGAYQVKMASLSNQAPSHGHTH